MIPRRRPDAPLQRISRRGLITSGMLAGVLAATGVSVHAQRRGGPLRLALPGAFGGWGIARQDLFARVATSGTVFETLTEITAAGELVGELALGWQAQDAGALWTVALRPDARFHDGRAVTATDVAASLLRHRDVASPCHWLLAGVQAVEPLDDRHLRIRMTAPDPDLPLLLADPHLVIAPLGAAESGIGSGLYRVVEAQDGILSLARVARHVRDGQAGWFDAVTLLPSTSARERLTLLAEGRADAAAEMPGHGPDLPGMVAVDVVASTSLLLAPPADAGLDAFMARPDRSTVLAALERDYIPDPARFHALGASALRHGPTIGNLAPLDNGRIAQRWWWG